jgi:hypothetical protein
VSRCLKRAPLALVAIVAAATLSAACSGGGNGVASKSSTSTTVLDDRNVLARVGLRTGDRGLTVSLLPGGDQVTGRVTLDVCAAKFPSEAKRVARLQQVGRDNAGAEVVSDENVQYVDAIYGAEALHEVRTAVAQCKPDQFHEPGVVGNPVTRDQIDVVPDSRLGGLVADKIGLETTMTTRDGRTAFIAAIYQRRGAILSAVYGPSIDEILPFAHVLAGRLHALTPQAVGEPQ